MVKNKRKKRLFPVLCILLIIIGDFIGLETVNGTRQTEPEPYELVMQWPQSGTAPVGLKDVEEKINEITEEKIGVSIRLLPSEKPVFEANLMIAAGDKLDLCVSLFGEGYKLINNGYLMQLDELVEERGQELKKVCGVQLKGGYYQNHIYGIPAVYSEGWRYGFICRTDLMEKYGFQMEEGKYYTFDELESFFRKVKKGEGEDFYILGGSLTCNSELLEKSAYVLDTMGGSIGTGVLMPEQNENRIVNFYETKEFEEFAERMNQWQKAGFFYPDTEISEDSPNLLMREGKMLGWFFHNVPGEEKENTWDSGWDATFIPTREAIRTTDVYQTALWSIPVTCGNPEKVMDFLTLLYTDERVSNLLQRGIEGSSYVVVEENEQGTLIDLPEGKNIETLPYYVQLGIYGNRLESYTWVPGKIDKNEKIREFSNSITRTSPAWGYVFDQEPVMVEASRIKDVVKKYMGIIETGTVDPQIELPMFRKELEEAGIDAVIAENQKQYDAWRRLQ